MSYFDDIWFHHVYWKFRRCSIHNFHFQSLALEAPYQGTPGIAQCPPENTDPWATVFEAQMAGNSHIFHENNHQIISDHICHIRSMEKNGSFKCQKPPISSDILQVFFWEFCTATDVKPGLGEPSFRTAAYLPVRIQSRCPGEWIPSLMSFADSWIIVDYLQ